MDLVEKRRPRWCSCRVATLDLDSDIVRAHVTGDSFRQIAADRGVSHETARKHYVRDSRKWLDETEMHLLVAAKLESVGRDAEAEWPSMVIAHGGPISDWQLALDVLEWTTTELRERGLPVVVESRHTEDGHVFQLRIEHIPGTHGGPCPQ